MGWRTLGLLALLLSGCGDEGAAPWSWSRALEVPEAALLGVHGRAPDDVWIVGADDGDGARVERWDGERFETLSAGVRADLWWVHHAPGGAVYLGGSGGTVLRYEDGSFEPLETPDDRTVYGIWAASANDVYAVGADQGATDGFLWHLEDDRFVELDGLDDVAGLFKVWGTSANDVWVVGAGGAVARGNASEGFTFLDSPTEATLFTVHAAAGRVVMVGGDAGGVVLEFEDGALVDRTPELAPLLQGVTIDRDGVAWAVGLAGSIYRSEASGDRFEPVDPGLDVGSVSVLHAAYTDSNGQLWTVGGNVLSTAFDGGLILHYGTAF